MGQKERWRKWYYSHLEEARKKGRENRRKYYLKNKELVKAKYRKYRKENPEVIKEYKRKHPEQKVITNRNYRKKYPERNKANEILLRAVKTHRIIRPKKCCMCNLECIPCGHHNDYKKPLDIIWVCRKCHLKLHNGNTTKRG